MKLARLALRHARPYWGSIFAVLLLQLISTIAALYLPSLNAKVIDQGVSKGNTDFIWTTGTTMVVVCFIQVAAAIGGIYFGARTAMAIGRDLRREVYHRVNALGALDVARFGTATLITRNTNDVQQVQMLVLVALNFMVSTPIMCIGGIIMALREDLALSWLLWVSVPLLFVVVGFLVVKLLPLFREMQERIDTVNGVLREQIVGIRVIRAFVREQFEAARYRDANLSLTRVSVRVGNLFVLMFPLIMMILHLATSAVLWFGGQRVDAGAMQIGSLTAFLQYLLQILVAVMMGVFMIMMIPRAAVSAERLDDLLSTEPSLAVPRGTDAPSGHAVEFKDVSFGYPGAERPVLNRVSFTAGEGRTTAIVGSTGSGKSTLVNLIPRLFDPQSGTVRIGGVDVSELSRPQLATLVGLVPQKPYLFSGTIASNIRFGRPAASDEDIWNALEVAQAKDFVEDKPKGLAETIAQGGTNVSGGQRQRLCIARALAARPRVFLFDDSFSALDVTTDERLRRSLHGATGGATVIIVAQRVSTIREADHIIVLDNGEVVGAGTHDELLEDNETYREIVESQLSVEGVA
ncbi:multidrug ABC transporter ATP-binding protein [Arthrobacter livingstonensis]|uniref:Multidrug ABC transporter ATP-binding protein n=1 Tax=Arthrobacter livingstonensis TaxID=670078 RepID=A0A2V5L2U3_9MICC|nr:ABC transporter ATP-binding protein [Arthrobacter livingstonensis]PYI65418.1 multidrug ABC transporter ATP-binding protein [Arthrobacter livingstonensis]